MADVIAIGLCWQMLCLYGEWQMSAKSCRWNITVADVMATLLCG